MRQSRLVPRAAAALLAAIALVVSGVATTGASAATRPHHALTHSDTGWRHVASHPLTVKDTGWRVVGVRDTGW